MPNKKGFLSDEEIFEAAQDLAKDPVEFERRAAAQKVRYRVPEEERTVQLAMEINQEAQILNLTRIFMRRLREKDEGRGGGRG